MKPDVLTITAVVFVVGVLLSSTGITDGFSKEKATPPPALHQGVDVR